jgi:hypothetical protein
MHARCTPQIHPTRAHQRLVASSGGSENRLKNAAGVVGNHEVAGFGHEVSGGARERFGEDSARLRRHETVVFAVPDLNWRLDLVQRDVPRPRFERVIVRHAASSLPEGLRHASAQSLSELVTAKYFPIGRSELVQHRKN